MIRTAIAIAFTVLLASPASAASVDRACKADAKAEKKECQLLCKEEFRIDLDLCRNVDHECAEACRAGREFCLYGDDTNPGPLARRAACKAACKDTQQASKQTCRDEFAAETPERAECIAAANLEAFLCRQPCRAGIGAEVKLCRRINKACMRACPPPGE